MFSLAFHSFFVDLDVGGSEENNDLAMASKLCQIDGSILIQTTLDRLIVLPNEAFSKATRELLETL